MAFKVYKTKHIIEVIEYVRIVSKREKVIKRDDIDEKLKLEVKEINREYYRNKQRQELRREIILNFDNKSYFATFTFRDKIEEVREGHKYINRYITNIRKKDKDIKYIAIPEYHQNGRVHYHMLINTNVYSIDELDKKWIYGISQIKNIDTVDNLGAYVTKYISKDIHKMEGRIVLKSRNIKKVEPQIVDHNPMQGVLPTYVKSWKDYYGNNVTYYQYNSLR